MTEAHHPTRRGALQRGVAIGATAAVFPWLAAPAWAQADDLGPYRAARINWRQAEGDVIRQAFASPRSLPMSRLDPARA